MANSWRSFGVLFGGFVLLFASVLGFVATVEHDAHCTLSEVRDDPRGDSVEYYYSELDDEQQQVFDRLQQNHDRTVHSDACIDGIVRYQDQYYVVDGWSTIRWTNLPTVLATGGVLGAGGSIVYVVWRQMKSSSW